MRCSIPAGHSIKVAESSDSRRWTELARKAKEHREAEHPIILGLIPFAGDAFDLLTSANGPDYGFGFMRVT
jgi:hypothetical protein